MMQAIWPSEPPFPPTIAISDCSGQASAPIRGTAGCQSHQREVMVMAELADGEGVPLVSELQTQILLPEISGTKPAAAVWAISRTSLPIKAMFSMLQTGLVQASSPFGGPPSRATRPSEPVAFRGNGRTKSISTALGVEEVVSRLKAWVIQSSIIARGQPAPRNRGSNPWPSSYRALLQGIVRRARVWMYELRILKKLEIEHEGGTLPDPWINFDIKPIEAGRRTWSAWTFTTYWVLINSNISSYMTGSSLIALGLPWWQAIIAIVIGNLLAAVFVVLNSLPGAYYHLGFPVVNRYVWGMYGFQAYIGGQCVYVCLKAIWPSLEQRIPNHLSPSTGITTAQFVSYIIFMVISLPVAYIRPHNLRMFFYISASVIVVFEFVLLVWALATMGPAGFGSTISGGGPGEPVKDAGWLVVFGIISTIGAISAGILNQNDYARFARKPRDAILGQVISFPIFSIICSVIGVLVTAATQKRFGEAHWDLPSLIGAIIDHGGSRSRAAAFFAGGALVISQIGVNIPGNALSGGFDLAATFPKYINIRRGAYITIALSIACNPWKLVSTATIFLSVLSSYAVFLGPMTGLMISAWFIVHRRKLKVEDLYTGNRASIYWFSHGFNWRAFIAWICGTVPSLPGFIATVNTDVHVPVGFTRIYKLCFLVGFLISAFVYSGMHLLVPDMKLQEYVSTAASSAVLIRDYRDSIDRGQDLVENKILSDA
ncbi:NCS1 nucleoside transporter [Trichophyton rubrum]|uniref:NCS1 nucleoside transporter n=1 Tax=Trichophyton rubrum TaxID=5551 RepID=A0A178EQY1_TRIRU|nr:NCS1 nucleoside transporter [Trichophyton rubrum]